MMTRLTTPTAVSALAVVATLGLAAALILTVVLQRPLSAQFEVSSGRLSEEDGALSGRGSIRAPTSEEFGETTTVTITARIDAWITDEPRDWFGLDVWSRYVDQFDLYAVQLLRPDGQVVISKKVHTPEDPANNFGAYYDLGRADYDWELGTEHTFTMTTRPEGDGLRFTVEADGEMILTAWDRGTGGPVHPAPARSGWRSDGAEVRVSQFDVAG